MLADTVFTKTVMEIQQTIIRNRWTSLYIYNNSVVTMNIMRLLITVKQVGGAIDTK